MPDGSRSFDSVPPDLDRVAALFREHFAFVRRVLFRCGVAPADLDDAVQDTFLVVHRRIEDFQGRSAERTWLYAVAVRVASTVRRSKTREHARRERAGAQMHGTGEADPEQELCRNEAAVVLGSLLDELDPTKRTVFVLAELEGVPVQEIAQIMDANVRTTHSRLRLARERFSAALQRHHAQESGRTQRASLRSLARHGQPAKPSQERMRAGWAALAVRISDGATALPIVWTGAAAAGKATSFFLPFTLTVGLGVVGLVAATTDKTTVSAARPTTETVAAVHPSAPRSAQPQIAPPSPAAEPRVAKVPETEASVVSRPPRESPSRKTPAADRTPAPSTPAVQGLDALTAETLLLERARASLKQGDAAAALRHLDKHAAEFPRGLLASERDSSRIKALCAAGKTSEAEKRANKDARLRAVFEASCPPSH